MAKGIPDNVVDSTYMVTESNKAFKFRNVCPFQVHDLIIKSANGKATGLDLISNKLLKIASPVISAHLTEIFNQYIEQSTFPDDLKVGKLSQFSSLVKGTIQETIGQSQFCQHLPEYLKVALPTSI